MNTIVGMVIVVVTIAGGYLLEHGNLSVLMQPAEFVIIFGAAAGAFIISSPGAVVKATIKDLKNIFSHGGSKESYIDLLLLIYELLSKARREGLLSLEKDIETPNESQIFLKHKKTFADEAVSRCLIENFRTLLMGVEPQQLMDIVEVDLEVIKAEALLSAHSLAKVADGLPGLGIVAAVLGVVITMGKISEPPEVLGHCIGAALVGTFIGVLACYGFVGPVAANLEHKAKEREVYFGIIRTALLYSESNPALTIEAARREIPISERPTFEELDYLKKKAK
ncbi:MAG: flagellar motor stator protein MotA [Pseudomonadota bacterium]